MQTTEPNKPHFNLTEGNFAQIPNRLLRAPIDPNSKAILVVIVSRNPSRQYLEDMATEAGMSKPTAIKAIKDLVARRIVGYKRGSNFKKLCSVYTILPEEGWILSRVKSVNSNNTNKEKNRVKTINSVSEEDRVKTVNPNNTKEEGNRVKSVNPVVSMTPPLQKVSEERVVVPPTPIKLSNSSNDSSVVESVSKIESEKNVTKDECDKFSIILAGDTPPTKKDNIKIELPSKATYKQLVQDKAKQENLKARMLEGLNAIKAGEETEASVYEVLSLEYDDLCLDRTLSGFFIHLKGKDYNNRFADSRSLKAGLPMRLPTEIAWIGNKPTRRAIGHSEKE